MVLERGDVYAPRDMRVKELCTPTTLILEDVHRPFMTSVVRRPNYRFGLMEACWILAASNDAVAISQFNSQMLKFSDDGRIMWGAYGPRVMGQLPHVIRSLQKDRDSRQAVVTTWRPMVPGIAVDNGEAAEAADAGGLMPNSGPSAGTAQWDHGSWVSKDVPCTVAWHFQLRNDRLNLTVFMRSNDVWLGLPYDLLSFTTVQRVVAAILGVEPGKYCHVVSNLHLYAPQWSDAELMLDEVVAPYVQAPVLPPMDEDFELSSVEDVQYAFAVLLEGTAKFADPWAKPFQAARHADDSMWRDWSMLQRANGRGKSADPKAG